MDGGEDGHEPADPDVLARARDGDLEAGVLLFDQHRQRIGVACRYLDVDETSEVFVSLLEDIVRILTSYDETRPLGPFLFVVARRRAISLLRRRPEPEISLEVLEALANQTTGPPTDDPERRAIGREILDRIRIDLTDAEWIVLRTCTGHLTDEAAASCLETTPAAIRIRRTRLRTKLRIHLEEGT